ncbi:unnamed protein product [Urochloa decumbens]|uniref:Uncharacterized protein n=1 Tax=Urochloa decumbens TaxID=240449 RepID=A0ABC8VF47_9POAL
MDRSGHQEGRKDRAPLLKMAGVMAGVATGVMNSVVDKLTNLLGEEYKLVSDVRRGIRFMTDELSSMNAVLQRLAERDDDQIDVQTKEWRSKVRELSYDIEDCVDRFIHLHASRKAKVNFVKSVVCKLKALWEDRRIAKEIQEFKALVVEEKERRDRYNIDQYLAMTQPVLLDPRAPTLYEEARDLVGIDGPRGEIIQLLKGEEYQLKVVSIFGIGGQGKTSLAMEVYHKIDEPFDCRASAAVSRTLDVKKLLRDILFQISRSEFERSEKWETEQLIRKMREHLLDKRYLIVIDDIWSISAWEHVQCALPSNNNRSRIITTTRSKAVAIACCTGTDGHTYEAKPLSENDSKRLLFRRIFGSSEDCPQYLTAVASDILRKCVGLPLAIISVAGLLANRHPTVEVWSRTLKSISSVIEKDSSIEKMRRILLLSYFDLPHYLKSCFLYLSVFPEDYSIDCRRLIWAWVDEGLIPGQNRESMEQLGESYLNQLINRSMLQATKVGVGGTIAKFCRIHDVVLDFVVSQAVEDNFVTIWNSKHLSGNCSHKIRRLSIQTADISGVKEMTKIMKNASHIRSINIFGSDLELVTAHVPEILSSQVLRVLNIQGRFNFQDYHIESLTRLKHLRIANNHIFWVWNLPEEIQKLQHLETLDVEDSGIQELPASIVRLQKLVRLFVPPKLKLPDGIRNLQALEELSTIDLSRQSAKSIQGLGDRTNLRILRINNSAQVCDMEAQRKECISSFSKLLTSLESLYVHADHDFTLVLMAHCGITPPVRRLVLFRSMLSTIPSQISSLVNLIRLRISVREVSSEGIKVLASLPMLLSLTVWLEYHSNVLHPRCAIGRQGFQCLVKFNFFCCDEAALTFEAGAMPKLQRLKLTLIPCRQFMYGDGSLVLGLQNLASLKHITVHIDCFDAHVNEVEALEDDIKVATRVHSNRPILDIKRLDQYYSFGPQQNPGYIYRPSLSKIIIGAGGVCTGLQS